MQITSRGMSRKGCCVGLYMTCAYQVDVDVSSERCTLQSDVATPLHCRIADPPGVAADCALISTASESESDVEWTRFLCKWLKMAMYKHMTIILAARKKTQWRIFDASIGHEGIFYRLQTANRKTVLFVVFFRRAWNKMAECVLQITYRVYTQRSYDLLYRQEYHNVLHGTQLNIRGILKRDRAVRENR